MAHSESVVRRNHRVKGVSTRRSLQWPSHPCVIGDGHGESRRVSVNETSSVVERRLDVWRSTEGTLEDPGDRSWQLAAWVWVQRGGLILQPELSE